MPFISLSATSVGAILVASYRLFFLVKWIGAAYLVFLGIKALLNSEGIGVGPAQDAALDRSKSRLFLDGLLTQLSNPKAFVFFGALLPQFIDPQRPVALQVAGLGITSELIEFCVLLAYGLAAGRAAILARKPRYATWMNRVSGCLLIGAGGGLALLRRD